MAAGTVAALPAAAVAEGVRPGPTTTGVRDGVELERVDGGMKVTDDGAVVEGLHLTGTLMIDADDVTVRDVRIDYRGDAFAIRTMDGHRRTTVEHVTIAMAANGGDSSPNAGVQGGRTSRTRRACVRHVTSHDEQW